jgi:hypothetical protein
MTKCVDSKAAAKASFAPTAQNGKEKKQKSQLANYQALAARGASSTGANGVSIENGGGSP